MAYVTQSQILGEIPAEWRDQALTDSGTGSTPDEVWAELQASVDDDIAGALSPAYDLPDPQANPAAVPLLRKVRSVARLLTLDRLFRRRAVPPDQNPWLKSAEAALADLRKLGQSEIKGPAPKASRNIKIVGESSRLHRTACSGGGCGCGSRRRPC